MSSLTPRADRAIISQQDSSDPIRQEIVALEETISRELSQLATLDKDIDRRKDRLEVLRDKLQAEISPFEDAEYDEDDEDIEAARHWIRVVDIFLNARNEYMEKITADVLLKLLDEVEQQAPQLEKGEQIDYE